MKYLLYHLFDLINGTTESRIESGCAEVFSEKNSITIVFGGEEYILTLRKK